MLILSHAHGACPTPLTDSPHMLMVALTITMFTTTDPAMNNELSISVAMAMTLLGTMHVGLKCSLHTW